MTKPNEERTYENKRLDDVETEDAKAPVEGLNDQSSDEKRRGMNREAEEEE